MLDSAKKFALMVVVNPLEIPTHQRIASRIAFYVATVMVFWVVGITQSSQSEIDSESDARLGVAKPYFGSSIDPETIRASR